MCIPVNIIMIHVHIHLTFSEILFNGYLVMAPDGWTNGRTETHTKGWDRHGLNYIPLPSAGGLTSVVLLYI